MTMPLPNGLAKRSLFYFRSMAYRRRKCETVQQMIEQRWE
jgi:hypothetical protein